MARESAAGAARRLLGGVGVDGGGRPPEPPEPGRPPGTVWVTNQTLNTVAAYEARTGELLRTVNVGARPDRRGRPTRIEAGQPALGRHLKASIRTGSFCSYQPERPVAWDVRPG